MTGSVSKEHAKAEAIEQKSTALTADVLWCCHAWNATAEQAAKQVVSDLHQHLSGGGTVSVRVTDLNGEEQVLDVSARQ